MAAQGSSGILNALPASRLTIKAGESAASKISFRLTPGYHTNSNTPSEEYLIPLRLTWDATPLRVEGVDYPKGHMEKYDFSEKPLSVLTGNFDISTRFQAPADTPKGPHTIKGKLRFQACSNTTCYPPKTISVDLAVQVH
ncbi:MAG: protein-disulfide reductase DsbD family protein [Bryobacteraceae bacterium]